MSARDKAFNSRQLFLSRSEPPSGSGQKPKSRKKDGYLSDEEDPARLALRLEEQATRSARQIYNLRMQVRALQDQVTRRGKVKHTKKVSMVFNISVSLMLFLGYNCYVTAAIYHIIICSEVSYTVLNRSFLLFFLCT